MTVIRTYFLALLSLFAAMATPSVFAANKTWTGAGVDRFWKTPGNWVGGAAPSAADSLFFGGTTHTTTTNNFAVDTGFSNITFSNPAGFFVLAGNEIILGGNITNNQVVTAQTISLPLSLSVTPTLNVVSNGVLSISGVISGSGGLTLTGGGSLNLSGNNTFTGNLTVNDSSTVVVGQNANLGAGNLVLDNGTLSATANLPLSATRGIAVGPGWGGFSVPVGSTLSYGGVIADNGGAGGLSKSGYGTLALSGANTYSGPTTNSIGTLLLDFTQAGSPATGIVNPVSSLELGGGNAGGGVENVAQLVMAGGVASDVQNFAGTFSAFGGSAILATNRSGGTVNLGLGALSHSPGGTIAFVTPEASGGGHITTTSPNVNSILGGYALISGDANAASTFTDSGHTLILGTNFAAVDGSGNIVNFTGYSNVTSASTVASQIAGGTGANIAINDAGGASVVNIASDNAGSTVDLNAIKLTSFSSGFDGISIGAGNTLRLGQFGGIIRNGPSTGNAVYIGGPNSAAQTGSGTTGNGDIGTLTAGGPNANTPGEIVVVANNPSETTGTTIFEPTIADNGTGPVTVVKMGPGSIKLDGHNTFSGGLYLLQGRVQFAGSEIGNANPDGGGVGPIFVLPGAYLFPSGIGTGAAITNNIFIAGSGDAHEPLGAVRGGVYSGTITLIGDADFGGNAIFNGPIVGPYNLTLGSAATVNGGATLNNSGDNWTGNTTLTARSNTGGNGITNGADNVIPSGFGYGNVTMHGFSTGTITWELNGFNQTVNGLATIGTDTSCMIQNNAGGTTSTLSIGNNDQSGTFGGTIQDAAGQVALTKIGGGIETLTGTSTYTGSTVINGGTLALSGNGAISGSTNIAINAGGTLDITGASGFSTPNPVQITGGTLAGDGSVGALTMNNAALTFDLNPSTVNLTASSLTLGGSSNIVNISTVNEVPGYPASFTLVQYAGNLAGTMNFAIGNVPNASTGGYISNDVSHSRIVLVLTNGPAQLTWVGNDPVNPTFWDDSVTTNWLAFKGTVNQVPSAFEAQDPVIFDDTASSPTVSLQSGLLPAFMTFNNNTLNYTLNGPGAIGGSTALIKNGTGSLTLLNTGVDTYHGGVTVNGGLVVFGSDNAITGGLSIVNGASVQVGVNAGAGTLPGGNVDDEGSLAFNRGTNLTVANAITGAGTITKQDTSVLTLSGNNTFTGPIGVQAGTLRAGSGTALGTGTTTVGSGAALDVNGQTLNTTALVTVSGTGVSGQGAIVNYGATAQNALGLVTLAGNTTFGGTNRWDIRGGAATLATSPTGSPYTLTKTGPNFIGLVNLTVDSALSTIDIQQGTLDYEGTTAGLGDPTATLTVENGATLELYNSSIALSKNIVLNGLGTNDTLLSGNGVLNAISGLVTVNGTSVFDATAGTTLTFNANLSGSGSVVKIGTGTNVIAAGATASYSGGTTISNGTLTVDGTVSSAVQVATNGTLSGLGTVSGNVSAMAGGVISPGDAASTPQATFTVGNLTLNNGTAMFELSSSPSSGNDLLAAGGLTLNGTNTLQIVPLSFMSIGDTYTLITYTGSTLPSSATNQLKVVSSRNFFTFAVVDPSTTPGSIQIKVLSAVGNDTWTGATSPAWDNTTTNWTRNSTPANFNDGDQATFDDSSSVNNVNITGTRNISGIVESAFSKAYTFSGTGSLTGAGGLDFEGLALTIANSGSNNFTGPIFINFGELQIGDGTTNGNLGSGAITNNGSMSFNRTDTNVVANAISGTGSLTNAGTGTLTLSGASTFAGDVTVARGTVRVLSSTALGNVTGVTTVSNGATLDITNNVNLGKESIFASGAGVGGNGAIINGSGNSGFVGANFSQLTISTNIVIGGPGRLDFRASSATAQDANLFTSGGGPSLIKAGTNLLQLAGVSIDSTFGDILVGSGTLGFQWQIPSLGDPARTLSVSNGASLAFYDMSNAVSKVFILNAGSTVLGEHGANNEFDGPVTLNGTNTFNISNGASLLFANAFGGSGNLFKTGPGNLVLSLLQAGTTNETYSGSTFVNQGTLTLLDTAALTNSPAIVLSNATLNVAGRVDGTLTIGAAAPQTLAGGGVIDGTLVENAGSTVNPGNGVVPAVLTVTNSATLNGSVVMDLNTAGTVHNDEIIAPSITASGTLTVNNLGPDLQAGSTFQLFSVPVAGFAAANLPLSNGSNKTYQWRNDVALNGSITLTNVVVSGGPTTNATITKVTLSGANLIVHGTNNNVPNNTFHYVVLTTTNVATPLTNWTPVVTNSFNADGTFDYTNPVVPGQAQQYIDVKAVP